MKPEKLFEQSIQLNIAYWLDVFSKRPDKDYGELISELQNLLRAIHFGISTNSSYPKSTKLLARLQSFIEFSGTWHAWIPLVQKAIANNHQKDKEIECRLLNQLGALFWLDCQIKSALDAHKRAAITAKSIQNRFQLAAAHFGLCQDYWLLQDYEKASRYANNANTEFTKLGNESKPLGVIYNALGIVAHACLEYEAAEDHFKTAIDIHRKDGSFIELARSINNLAITLQELGKYKPALQFFSEAANLLSKTHNEMEKSKLEYSRASLHMKLGNLKRAKSAFNMVKTQDFNPYANSKLRSQINLNLGKIDKLLANEIIG